jgi:hypothetical protein
LALSSSPSTFERMNAMTQSLLSTAFGLAILLSAGGAWADAIDGDWCAANDARHMSIKGPEIVTPGGTRMNGNYTRHSFLYVVPPAEPGAGQTVAMILVNEETVNLRQAASAADASQAPVQVWHRCAPTISAIGGSPEA